MSSLEILDQKSTYITTGHSTC